MANSEISVSSVDHRQEPSPSTTFSIYGLAAVSITYLRSILAPILGHQMEHVSKIDRRTTKHGARFRITVPEDRQRNIIQRLERQSKQTHWRIRQNYRHRRPDQPRPTAPPPPLSRQILAVNVANISNKRPAIRHIVRNTRLWAISETCITSSKFRFTVPGFDVIQHPATGPGRRGIALGIPSCFGGHEHGSAVGTMILAKVPNFTPECLWIVGSVYVGHSGATTNYSRREAFASIRQSLDRVVPFDNNHPVLIFGDWNTDPQRLQRIVHSWGHGLTVMQFSGSQITRLSTVHGRRHSSIDHFVCNAPARALLTSPRVDRQTAVADHFVIRTSIRAEAQGQPPVPHGASDDTDTDTDVHQLTSQFLESANAVADQLSLRLSPPATRFNRRLLSGTTKRAILASNTARQAFISAATNRNPDPVQCNTLRDEWSRLKAAATQLERVDGRKQWVKHADNLDRAVSDGRTDLVFAAARAMSGNSSRSAAVTPLYNSDGIVQYDPTSILRVMQETVNILDQDFSWNQIAAALLQMSPRKAPGDDGITTAFYQAALYMPANTQEGVPPTPFARALLRVCGQVFASATIPRAWLCASIVSIDKKDGDPLNPGDKRGIALINVGLKLVCKVLQMRIERFVETNNLLSYEQAGFRKREECVGQVVSLVDIIQRRQNAGLNTHVLFIDIRKAFDTVPVGALLWKLQNMGFPRRTLAFLKALYTSSSARARAGSLLSDPFQVQRGCQTGMSIVWTTIQSVHQRHSRWCRTHHSPWTIARHNPIRGLMYADDVAVFADSEQSLLAASTAIEQWANQWEMQFGVAKCGIISFTGHLAPRLDKSIGYSTPWTVAYYGLELVGGNKSHLAPLQTTINKGIRLFTGARLSTAIGPLLVETGIGSLLTRSLVSRLVRSQRWFWSRRTKQLYRNRYWLTPQVRPKTVKQRHSFALMETLRTCGDSASLQKYVTRQLLDTSGFFKDPSFDQSRAHGTRYLMLARMDALWTARKAIQIGILVDTHPFSSPGHRIQSGLVPAIQKSRLRLLGRALDPGVENVYTWLRGGVLNGEADLDQQWLDGTVEHESMGTRHDNRALAARLADFLQLIHTTLRTRVLFGPGPPFARALLRVCGQVFASATIPRAWLCASIVSIDKKDGDPLNPGDKRGIALINVGLKLVCKVLQMRIERFVETNNLLSYEQAGFRKREECVGQVVSLVDIIQRRQNAGINTHVLFIDIRKAFDTVPVGALLWKLQNMGFPRRTLAFLKALYTSSSARARTGSLLSDPFPVQRGVRQGFPLSGLLFNLFINDILDGVAPITVPGLPQDTNPIRGLMYADDVTVFADSEQSLLAALTAIEQWANRWEMQFGVAKCGIISFTGHLAPRLDSTLDIGLHGQLVSRVESYKYLGVLIDSKLDHSAWLKQKRSVLDHTISVLHPVLANHQLTVNYRSRIFSAVVMGKAYYGLELVGGNKSHLAPLQTTINKGIRLFTGARLSTAIGPLLVETGIGSLLTRSLVSRVRLLDRSVTKRTPINAICSRNRYWLIPQVRPKTVKQRHSFALMETLQTCGDSASLQKYVTRQLLDTSGFFKDPSFDQSRAHGTRYLMLARMDALWTARKAIQIGILVNTHPFSVDHCILCDQQLLSTSIAHLVVECEQVTGHRIQSGLVPAIQKSRLRLLGRALDPGVENVYTWLRGGVLNGEADLDQRWLDGTVEHESMGTRHDNRALAARLADFLQFIQKKKNVDIIQRRQNAGLNTHVLFIDIRKAFDTVPVGALLWKLQNMGFPRRTLAFLKALYTSSSARARTGSLLSNPFPVQRGVRQGCPLSGLLFNLFINDILDGVAPITVPGLPRDTNPIRGLMYADDVAVFADSEQSLLAALTAIEQWANWWEMQFGVAKCGHHQLHWPSSTTT
ncbi:hypothetical protein BASA83_001259 [Batrachochytrium salamandrivorans]|nr:hypothetical protein BASA83_001259 [Batrachochytrium salamandrivorans]